MIASHELDAVTVAHESLSLTLSQHSNSSTSTPFSAWNLGLEVTVIRKIQFDPDYLIHRSVWKGFSQKFTPEVDTWHI